MLVKFAYTQWNRFGLSILETSVTALRKRSHVIENCVVAVAFVVTLPPSIVVVVIVDVTLPPSR